MKKIVIVLLCIVHCAFCIEIDAQEVERRATIDYNKRLSDLLPYIEKYYPEVDSAQIARWEESKALEYRMINGEKWYFRRAAENLFRIDPEARALKMSLEGKERAGRDTVVMKHVRQVLKECHRNGELVAKHEWEFDFKLYFTAKAELQDGELIKVWLPMPKTDENRQTNVRVSYTNREVELYSGVHSTTYMEVNILIILHKSRLFGKKLNLCWEKIPIFMKPSLFVYIGENFICWNMTKKQNPIGLIL